MIIGKGVSVVGLFALFAVFGWGTGCHGENPTAVDCVVRDCESSCELKGYPRGVCEDDMCLCEGLDGAPYDGGPYEWDDLSPSPGEDNDTDTIGVEDGGGA